MPYDLCFQRSQFVLKNQPNFVGLPPPPPPLQESFDRRWTNGTTSYGRVRPRPRTRWQRLSGPSTPISRHTRNQSGKPSQSIRSAKVFATDDALTVYLSVRHSVETNLKSLRIILLLRQFRFSVGPGSPSRNTFPEYGC